MIHVFGDSFTYGYNFLREKHADFKNMVYPYFLSEMLNIPFVNHSYPGSNNWRIGRKISSLNLNADDIVIIAWTSPERFELGVGENHISILDKVVDVNNHNIMLQKYDFSSQWDKVKFFDDTVVNVIIKDEDVYTRQFTPWGEGNKIKNHHFREMYKYAYTHFGTIEWLNEMFLQIFCSTVYQLRMVKCKFLMFNTFSTPCIQRKKNDLLEISEYIPSPYMDMTNYIRNNENKKETSWINNYLQQREKQLTYWNIKEHKQVADIIFESLKRNNI